MNEMMFTVTTSSLSEHVSFRFPFYSPNMAVGIYLPYGKRNPLPKIVLKSRIQWVSSCCGDVVWVFRGLLMSLRVLLDNLHLNNIGHLSSFHIFINYEGNRDTMGMANNKRALQYSIGHKGQWESSLCMQYQTLHE